MTPLPPQNSALLLDVLLRLPQARSLREVARCVDVLVDRGALVGVGVWCTSERVPRRLSVTGMDEEALDTLMLGTNSPIHQAVDQARPIPVPGGHHLSTTSARWQARPVLLEGSIIAVVLSGEPVDGLPVPWTELLPPLAHALRNQALSDRNAVRAELYERLVQNTADGVIAATPDGEILGYNPTLSKMTGWTLDDIQQHGWTNLVYTDPQARRDARDAIAALALGAPSIGIERELARKDGTTFRARIWSHLVPHPSGFAPAMLGVIRSTAGERTARRAAWEQSQNQVEALAAHIAHEFNNLLAAIMGHADLITLLDVPDAVRRHAQTIVDSATRGAEMSTQIQAFSGSAPIRPRPMDIAVLVREVAELFRPRIPAGGALLLDVPATLPIIDADPGQLQQALINLLTNAVGASPTGQVRLQAKLADLPENARYRSAALRGNTHPGPMIRLRVADDGAGFSEDALSHLFTPFYTEKTGGHGVGLPAVRGILGAHGGAVDVQNDDGAVIDLYLPPSRRPELSLPTLQEEAEGSGSTVWIVDDEPTVLEFSRISLEAQGFRVRTFGGVDELRAGVREASLGAPDAVVIDMIMPSGGGLAAHAVLEAAQLAPVIVWTSGHAPESLELPGRDHPFLRKPYTGRTLGRLVEAALRRQRA